MRRIRNICLQSTMRQRARTLFLLLLIGLISFAFVSRAVEYLVVDRETERLAGYYRAIGRLTSEVEGEYDVRQGVELISNSQYVAFEDWKRYCPGVLQGLYNADVDGWTGYYANLNYSGYFSGVYIDDVVVYGELRSKSPLSNGYQFTLDVDQVAAGYPEHIQEGNSIRVRWLPENPGDVEDVYDSLQVGQRYFVKANYDPVVLGSAFILRPLSENGLWLLPVEPGAEVDLSDPTLAELAEELLVSEENRSMMSLGSTKDMSAMPVVQESSRAYYLVEGRWLNREDDLNGNRVCVVHHSFASLRGLTIGDTLTVKLRNLKDSRMYIVPGVDWGGWQDYDTHTEEFKIVGLYGSHNQVSTASTIFMFIPDSCMPAGYGDSWKEIDELDYSFILRSPWDIEAFLAENQEALAELGLKATFLDTGWENFQASIMSIRRAAAMSAGVFAIVLVLALSLAAFLYLRQRRRDFAILRSLGVPRQTAIRQTLQPIALVGAVGILTGGLAAWVYALGKTAEILASLQGPEGEGPSATLSPIWLAGLCATAFALLLLFTTAGTVITARSPVLELLQGVAKQGAGRRKPETDAVPEGRKSDPQEMPARAAITLGKTQAPTGNHGIDQSVRYVLRHTRRSFLKSTLTVAVALCFTLALGWMSWTMECNEFELDRLYRTTPVEAVIIPTSSSSFHSVGFIRRRTVDIIMATGFIQGHYLEAATIATQVSVVGAGGAQDSERTDTNVSLRAFERPEQFFAKTGEGITVEYAQGWTESLFTRDWTEEELPPVLLPVSLLSRLQLDSGENVIISIGGTTGSYTIAGRYTGLVKGSYDAEPILLPLSALGQIQGAELLYTEAEFVLDPTRNRDLPEFRAQMEALFSNTGVAGTVPLTFLFLDEELTQVVEPLEKNLQLMEILFPVTVAVSVLIAAGLAALLMFQAAREASIMRVLGTTKGRSRAMLCGEQLFLCLMGLLLGLALLIVLQRDAAAVLTGPALVCAALYLAGVICGSIPSAVSVTNRMPLELLQVKE